MVSVIEEIKNAVEDLAKDLTQPRIACVYAHDADQFIVMMVSQLGRATFSRQNHGTGIAYANGTLMGLPVFTQSFLLPGTALLIDQWGQIMKVVRYAAVQEESEQ